MNPFRAIAQEFLTVVRGLASARRRGQRRSLENPSTPLSAPDEWLYDAFGAGPSSSGINVSRTTALTYAALWRGVNLISDTPGRLPLHVKRRRKKKGWKKDQQHPAYFLLRRKANPQLTAGYFRKTLTAHALLEGNGYAYIERRGDGAPLALWPLNPDQTYPVRANGQLWYVWEPPGEFRKIRAEDILHLKGLGYDGLQGYNVIAKARESLGLGMAAARYGSMFFRNGSRPNIALEYPGKLSEQAQTNLRNSWERAHAGLDGAHKVALLFEGVKLHQYSINARDAQLLEMRKFELGEVANWLGLPVHKLGGEGRTAYASLEQENQACLDEGYDPWLCRWEEECWDKLLTEKEKLAGGHETEFSRRHLVHAALDVRTRYYATGIQSGWLSPDEAREQEGMNPIKGGKGKAHFRPMNLVELGQEPPAKAPPAKADTPAGDGQGDGKSSDGEE